MRQALSCPSDVWVCLCELGLYRWVQPRDNLNGTLLCFSFVELCRDLLYFWMCKSGKMRVVHVLACEGSSKGPLYSAFKTVFPTQPLLFMLRFAPPKSLGGK